MARKPRPTPISEAQAPWGETYMESPDGTKFYPESNQISIPSEQLRFQADRANSITNAQLSFLETSKRIQTENANLSAAEKDEIYKQEIENIRTNFFPEDEVAFSEFSKYATVKRVRAFENGLTDDFKRAALASTANVEQNVKRAAQTVRNDPASHKEIEKLVMNNISSGLATSRNPKQIAKIQDNAKKSLYKESMIGFAKQDPFEAEKAVRAEKDITSKLDKGAMVQVLNTIETEKKALNAKFDTQAKDIRRIISEGGSVDPEESLKTLPKVPGREEDVAALRDLVSQTAPFRYADLPTLQAGLTGGEVNGLKVEAVTSPEAKAGLSARILRIQNDPWDYGVTQGIIQEPTPIIPGVDESFANRAMVRSELATSLGIEPSFFVGKELKSIGNMLKDNNLDLVSSVSRGLAKLNLNDQMEALTEIGSSASLRVITVASYASRNDQALGDQILQGFMSANYRATKKPNLTEMKDPFLVSGALDKKEAEIGVRALMALNPEIDTKEAYDQIFNIQSVDESDPTGMFSFLSSSYEVPMPVPGMEAGQFEGMTNTLLTSPELMERFSKHTVSSIRDSAGNVINLSDEDEIQFYAIYPGVYGITVDGEKVMARAPDGTSEEFVVDLGAAAEEILNVR